MNKTYAVVLYVVIGLSMLDSCGGDLVFTESDLVGQYSYELPGFYMGDNNPILRLVLFNNNKYELNAICGNLDSPMIWRGSWRLVASKNIQLSELPLRANSFHDFCLGASKQRDIKLFRLSGSPKSPQWEINFDTGEYFYKVR